LGKGSGAIAKVKEHHRGLVAELVKLASLQANFTTIDEDIKKTSRRVNALEYGE